MILGGTPSRAGFISSFFGLHPDVAARLVKSQRIGKRELNILAETKRLLAQDAARTPTRRPTTARPSRRRSVSMLQREQWLAEEGERLKRERLGRSGTLAQCERRLNLARLNLG
jgi:hypothetical protein